MVQTKFKGDDSTYINEVLDLYKIKIGKDPNLWKYILGTILGFPIIDQTNAADDNKSKCACGGNLENSGMCSNCKDTLKYDNVNKQITINKSDEKNKATWIFDNCGVCLPDNPKYGKKGSAAEMFGAVNMWKERGSKNINRSDVNAVGIGHWFTFMVMSNDNLCLRDIDIYHPEE